MLALLMVQHAEQVQGVGVFLLPRQDLLVQPGRGGQLAGLVQGHGACQDVLHGVAHCPALRFMHLVQSGTKEGDHWMHHCTASGVVIDQTVAAASSYAAARFEAE